MRLAGEDDGFDESRGKSPVEGHFPFLPSGSAAPLFSIFLNVLVEAVCLGLIPVAAGWLIDHAVLGRDQGELWNTLILVGDGTIAALIAGVLRDYLLARFHSRTVAHIRQHMFVRMQRIPVGAEFPAGDETQDPVLDRFTNDLAIVEEALAMAVPWGVLPLLESLLCTILMLGLSWRQGIFVLPLWPWILLASRRFAYRAAVAGDAAVEHEEKLLGEIEDAWSGQLLIRAFGLEQTRSERFRGRNEALAVRTAKAGWLAALLERFTGTGVLLSQVAVLAVGARLAASGRLSPGTLCTELLLAVLLGNSLQYLAEYLPAVTNTLRAWSRIHEGLDGERLEAPDAPGARILPPLSQEIILSGVGYAGQDPLGAEISGVSLRIPRGAHVAFVGPSGSGKSSLLRMLLRFQDPAEGRITFDGHDLRAVTRSSLRSQIGFVPQHSQMFHGTVLENIQLGRPDASEEALLRAASQAGLAANSPELPQGFSTLVDENPALSTETTQRIALARALLRDPRILLLDEAASALEPAEEVAFNLTLKGLRKGRTVVSVTHRLASVADADIIYYFEGGRLLEQGSHFELLACQGGYADLWRKQAGFRFSADGRHVDVDAQRLQSLPILEHLDEPLLSGLAPFFATENFPAGRDIVCQNDPGDKFYIIVRGRVDVWRMEEHSGRTLRVASLHDGDFFGEITLITGFPRTATVRTVTPCTCISIERGQFLRMMDGFPDLRRELSEVAVRRLRESSRAAAEARR